MISPYKKHHIFSVIALNFVFSLSAMNTSTDTFDPQFNRFVSKALSQIRITQEKNERTLRVMYKCLQDFYLNQTTSGTNTVAVDYDGLFSISAQLHYGTLSAEDNKKIERILNPFFYMGYFIEKGYSGRKFIPAVSHMARDFDNDLQQLPKFTRNILIELMKINTQILLNVPFELLNTDKGISILNRSNFGTHYEQFCLLETELVKILSSVNALGFTSENQKAYAHPFTEIFARVSKKTNNNWRRYAGPALYHHFESAKKDSPKEAQKKLEICNLLLAHPSSHQNITSLQDLEQSLDTLVSH